MSVSERVTESYRARFGFDAVRTTAFTLTDAIDLHVHATGGGDGDPLAIAKAATRAGMSALLFKDIGPGGPPWAVARRVQEALDRWAAAEGLPPVRCLPAWVCTPQDGGVDPATIRTALANGVRAVFMPPRRRAA